MNSSSAIAGADRPRECRSFSAFTVAAVMILLLDSYAEAQQSLAGIPSIVAGSVLDRKSSAHMGEYDSSGIILPERSAFDIFPILMYDTDIGCGYGLKGKLVNALGHNESLDLTAFNSTKGERWYRFVASLPDVELRQGKTYQLAIDLAVDYDKLISNSFFGIGNSSSFEAREFYTREPMEFSLTLSRAFSRDIVVQAGLSYRSVRNFNFETGSRLAQLPPSSNNGTVRVATLMLDLRYDTRNSFFQPSRGVVLEAQAHVAPAAWTNDVPWTRVSVTAQQYSVLFFPQTVFAFRLMGSTLFGDDLPIQILQSLGGNRLLRGSPQDRYLDRTLLLFNGELRFPMWWRFGGILGFDAGKVWSEPSKIDLSRWAANPVVGLRFAMETFIVRLDVGFGHETTGVYFNFDHIF